MPQKIGNGEAGRDILTQQVGCDPFDSQQAIIMRLVFRRNNSAQNIPHAPGMQPRVRVGSVHGAQAVQPQQDRVRRCTPSFDTLPPAAQYQPEGGPEM